MEGVFFQRTRRGFNHSYFIHCSSTFNYFSLDTMNVKQDVKECSQILSGKTFNVTFNVLGVTNFET